MKTAVVDERELVTPVAKVGIYLDELYKQAAEIQELCTDSLVSKVSANNVRFDGDSGTLVYKPDSGSLQNYHLSSHAMTQLCTKIGVPTRYIEKCLTGGMTDLAADNVNQWLHEYGKSLFIREYNSEHKHIRGILSDRYMALDTPDILSVLSDVLNPKEYATKGYFLTPERFHARIVQRNMMNVAGEDLFPGIQIDSSDVGRSTLLVRFFIFKQVCTNGLCISKGGGVLFEQRHIGVNLLEFRDSFEESMKRIPLLVENASELVKQAMQDSANKYNVASFNKSQMDDFVEKLRLQTKLPEESVYKVIDLMSEKYFSNRWGLVNSLTEVAQDFTLEKRIDLEKFAGDLLMNAA